MFFVIWIISLSLSLFRLFLKKEEEEEKQDERKEVEEQGGGGKEEKENKFEEEEEEKKKDEEEEKLFGWCEFVTCYCRSGCLAEMCVSVAGRQHWAVNWCLWPVGVAVLQKREGEKGSIELCTVLAVEYVKDQLLDNRKNAFKVSWGYSVLPAWGWTSVWLLHE